MTLERLQELVEKALSPQHGVPAELVGLVEPQYQASYYKLMYLLAQEMKPDLAVELGVHRAMGSAAFAQGNPDGRVVGFDTEPHPQGYEVEKVTPNFTMRIVSSSPPPGDLRGIGLLFLDTSVGMKQAEWSQWLPLLAEDAVVLMDDLNSEDGRLIPWFDALPYDTYRDDRLHPIVGFGIVLLSAATLTEHVEVEATGEKRDVHYERPQPKIPRQGPNKLNVGDLERLTNWALAEEPLGIPFLDGRYQEQISIIGHTNPYYRLFYYLAQEFQPRRCVELGVWQATTSAHVAAACPECDCIGVDIWREDENAYYRSIEVQEQYANFRIIRGWTEDPEIIKQVPVPIDLLYIDGWHDYEHSNQDWENYGSGMKSGGVVVCDDLYDHNESFQGMRKFWKEMQSRGRHYLSMQLHPGIPFGIVILD